MEKIFTGHEEPKVEITAVSVEEELGYIDAGHAISVEQRDLTNLQNLHSVSLELFVELLDVTIAMEELVKSEEDFDDSKAMSLIYKNSFILDKLGLEANVSLEADQTVKELLQVTLEANGDSNKGLIAKVTEKLSATGKKIGETMKRMGKAFTDFFKSYNKIIKQSGDKLKTLGKIKEADLSESDLKKLLAFYGVFNTEDMNGNWDKAIKAITDLSLDFEAFGSLYKNLGTLGVSTGEGKKTTEFKESNPLLKNLIAKEELSGYENVGHALSHINGNKAVYAVLFLKDGAIIRDSVVLKTYYGDFEVNKLVSKTPSIEELGKIHNTLVTSSKSLQKKMNNMGYTQSVYAEFDIKNVKSLNIIELAKTVKRFIEILHLLEKEANWLEWNRFQCLRDNLDYGIKLLDYSFSRYDKK